MSSGFSDSALLVPPSRLGRVLRDQRAGLGRSIVELSKATNLSAALLEDAEQGRARLDDSLLETLAAAYEIDVERLTPQRSELIIDLDEGWISASDHQVAVGDDDVLARYLALVYALREMAPGTPVPLRELDVGVLAHALGSERVNIESQLTSMMTTSSSAVTGASRGLRERIVVPLAGILVGVTAVGGLVLVRSEPVATIGDEIPLDIGDAVMIAGPGEDQVER